jgi:hypothetical protein
MNMRSKLVAVLLIVVVCSIVGWIGYARHQTSKRSIPVKDSVTLSNETWADWSSTGEKLYYLDNRKLWQLDTRTGKKRMTGLSDVTSVSPDEKYVLYILGVTKGLSISICDMKTGKERFAYKSDGYFKSATWLVSGKLIVVGQNSASVLDIIKKTVTRIEIAPMIASIDNDSIVPCREGSYYYIYDLAKRSKIKLPSNHIEKFYYLSQKMVVFLENGTPKPIAMNLKTMSSTPIDISPYGDTIRISPNLSYYWVSHLPVGEWSQSSLQLEKIPESSVNVLRKIEGR